jgi:hypothetical protein
MVIAAEWEDENNKGAADGPASSSSGQAMKERKKEK